MDIKRAVEPLIKNAIGIGYKKKRGKMFLSFFVPRIGLEPTCREALAPETSVSTISPPGHRFVAQR